MEKIYNYIGGDLVSPLKEQYIKNYSPTNGVSYSLVPNSTTHDVDLAIDVAKKSFDSWSQEKKEFRHDWMMKLAQAIDDNAEKLVVAESFDNGKPEWLAREVDIPRCSANIRFFATFDVFLSILKKFHFSIFRKFDNFVF